MSSRTRWRTSTTSTTRPRAPRTVCWACRSSPTRCSSSAATSTPPAHPTTIKRAEICRQRMAPVLRRLAMNYPPIMAHGINTITAYKGQVIYDTPATEAKAQTYIPYLEWIPADGRSPPRAGEDAADPSSLLLPPNPVPGPPPPAPPHTLAPGALPPPPGPAPRSRPQRPPVPGRGARPAAARRSARPAAGRGRRRAVQPDGGGG